MNVRFYMSVAVATLLFGGCWSSNDDIIAQPPAETAFEFTGDVLAKEIKTTTVSDSKLGADDKVFDVSANTRIINDNYTYNYSDDGGILAVQKIDWAKAVDAKKNTIKTTVDDNNLTSGYSDGNYTATCSTTLPKPIPKVICDVDNSLCLTYNITCLKEDVTVAVTPYKTILSMPNGAKFAIDDNNTPLTGISADVSVQDSNGKKLSIEEANKVVKLTAKITNKNSQLATDSYKLYKINGNGNTTTDSNITLTNSNSKVTSEYVLNGFYPYVIAKAATFESKAGKITLDGTPLSDASIIVLDDNNETIAQSKTNGLGEYSYKVLSSSGKTKILSSLLKDGVYENATILNGDLDINASKSASVVKTSFDGNETAKIKGLLGKKIYSSGDQYYEASPSPDDIYNYVVRPASLSSELTYDSTLQQLFFVAINSFLKGEKVNSSNTTNYSIMATDNKLTISRIKTSTNSNDTYNENVTLTITKNSDETYAFVLSEYVNNSYLSSGSNSKSQENVMMTWTGKNEIIDASGAQIQSVKNGKRISSESHDWGSSGLGSKSENTTFNVVKSGDEFIVSSITSKTKTENSSYIGANNTTTTYESSESYTMKAKYALIINEASTSYTMGNIADVVFENLTAKGVQSGTTLYDLQNVNINATKRSSSITVNGIDASSW